MLNHIILIGRLVRDPELRYTTNGTAVCNFTLAVERNYTDQSGKKPVDFIKIITWRKLAETCAHHLGKGRLVAVDGSLQIRKSESNGRTYINPEVIASEVRFLDWPKNDNKNKSKDNTGGNSGNNYGDFNIDDNIDVPF